jgi:hypothetical protein
VPPKTCSTLIHLPVGPGTHLPFLFDTLESIERFALPHHQILLVDDSAEDIGAKSKAQFPKIDVLVMRKPGEDATRSVTGNFFEKISRSIKHATENYSFQALMRMDADALMCNSGGDANGMEIFLANAKLGMIGSFKTRCDGQPRDFQWSADHLKKEAGFQLLPDKRKLSDSLNVLLKPARAHGYEDGENIIAPGSMTSRAACEKMCAHPLYGSPLFRPTKLGDDHLNSLFLRAVGFEPGDFATGDLPLGVWLKNLEWSPEEIVQRGKCVAHSVRSYKDLDEKQVRAEFKKLRQ